MTIIATIGDIAANSYVTEDEAEAYFEGRLASEGYIDADDEIQEQALRQSARSLDARVTWIGDIKDQTTPQALAWPRVYDYTLETPEDILVLGASIPQDLKNAQIEFALFLINNGEPTESDALDAIKVGSLTIDFNEFKTSRLIPDEIWTMISYLGSRFTSKEQIKSVAVFR